METAAATLFNPRERKKYNKQLREAAAPTIASNFSGWLIFELQIIALTNVHGVSTAQVAAGANLAHDFLPTSRRPTDCCSLLYVLPTRWRRVRSGCSASRRSPLRSRDGSR